MNRTIQKNLGLWVALILTTTLQAQNATLTGKIIDQQSGQSLVGANIICTNTKDTLIKNFTISDTNGDFVLKDIKPTSYLLTVSFLGYQKYSRLITVVGKEMTLPDIPLISRDEKLNDVTVVASSLPAIMKGDTTEFTSAAYKVNPDANVEDLVKKMPGISIEDGTVKAHGEEVKKVLVDGKPFFGDDPSIALKNLPAEIIEKVQIFDQQSEQSQLTGFNDGQTAKTMNIVTRSDRRSGRFGNVVAGYGSDDRYVAAANLNQFKGEQRLSAILSSNNINRQNFGSQDFLGAMGGASSFGGRGGSGRSGGGSSFGGMGGGGNQNGISTIHSIGLNYSNVFKEKLTLSGSYFYNVSHNENNQTSNTQYILSADSSRLEYNSNISDVKNYNHRFNARAEWKIDSLNTLIVVPSINFQDNKSTSGNDETQSYRVGEIINEKNLSKYNSNTNTSGFNIGNRVTYRHKFIKQGRTLSADVNTTYNSREPLSNSTSNLTNLTTGLTLMTDRKTNTTNEGVTVTSNIAYSEPWGKKSMVQVNASNSYTRNDAFKQTNDKDTQTSTFNQIDSLSNKYLNHFITNKVGLTYRYRTDKMTASMGAELQNANLSGDQTYPQSASTDKQFNNVLPNAYANIKLSDMQRLTINYRTSTAPPSISQLQDVSEYSSNLTRVTKGNPNLEPQYQHSITSRLMRVNKEKKTNFFVLFGGSITQNSIGNSTIYHDTIQITTPVNKGTGYNLRSMSNYGFTITPIKCNMNISGGYNYSRTPGFVNGNENIANTHTLNLSGVISSNISEKIDFTLSTNGSYSNVHNTVSGKSDNEYYSQNSGFRFNWLMWKNFTFQNDVTNRFYKGLSSSSYNQNITVVNLALGKKMFKNNAGEFKISVNDLFNNNTSISRTITANQITDTQSNTLNRYYMATFTYTFRNFKKGDMPEKGYRRSNDQFDRDRHIDGPPAGGRMGSMGPPPGM